jgi:hypothetical protein
MKGTALFVSLLLIGSSLQLYGGSSKVIQLTDRDFKEKVINSNGIWLVEFYGNLDSQ